MRRILLIVNFFIFFLVNGAAETTIVNPASGTWANRQILVLDSSDGEEVFYSLNGSDPLQTGFAYDGPVLIDMVGTVQLRVVSISRDGSVSETGVLYTVEERPPTSDIAAPFSNDALLNSIVEYHAGLPLTIMQPFSYSFGKLPASFCESGTISIAADCILTRYVPCMVTDGTAYWRFIIKTVPSLPPAFSTRDIPFALRDWNTIMFIDKKLIYKIDNSYWDAMKVPQQLDRSIPHTISWQSIAFQQGNPIESFVLPPKPVVETRASFDGSLSIVVNGDDGYRIGIASDSGVMFFNTVGIDTFPGDEIAGTFSAGIYYNSVYQGTIEVPYEVDKRAPAPPIINSNEQLFFSRHPVELAFAYEDDAQLFVAIEEMAVYGDITKDDARALFSHASTGTDFFAHPEHAITLDSFSGNAVYCCARAYAVDKKGNKSSVASYDVVIDKYNYYISDAADERTADGTRSNPFASFEQCLAAIGENRFANIRVTGTLTMPEGETQLFSNCVINGQGDTQLIFPSGSSLVVRSASLEIDDCIIMRNDAAGNGGAPLIKLEHAVLTLADCEVVASFARNGTIIRADSSVVVVTDSGLTSSSSSYSSCIGASDTKIKIQNSRVSTVAQTAVNFSVQGGEFELHSSSCKVTGMYGRAVELFGALGKITENSFTAELRGSVKVTDAVYEDANNVLLEYSGNTTQGY